METCQGKQIMQPHTWGACLFPNHTHDINVHGLQQYIHTHTLTLTVMVFFGGGGLWEGR